MDDAYFDDAVFIGDSRTEGLILYTGLANATVYANQGLMVDTVFTRPVIQMDGQKLSVVDALRRGGAFGVPDAASEPLPHRGPGYVGNPGFGKTVPGRRPPGVPFCRRNQIY